MDSIDLLTTRRSVRQYKQERVPRALMEEIIDIARWAPSWANFQIARYTVVDQPELVAELAQGGVDNFAYNTKTLKSAQAVVVLSFVKGKSGRHANHTLDENKAPLWEAFDAGIACQTFCLAAHAKGVGTCIFGIINGDRIRETVNLPEDETVAALITYGFPEGDSPAKPRKSVEEIARFLVQE